MVKCARCETDFERPAKSKRATCSRTCAAAMVWRNPETRQRMRRAISASKRTPEALAITAETNRRRWARPGEREKLAERNRRMWADSTTRKILGALIRGSWTKAARESFSLLRKRQWRHDRSYRERTIAGIRRSKQSAEARALFSALLRDRWKDPAWREKWAAGMRRRMAKPEERQKASAALKRWWATAPEAERKRVLDALWAGRARTAHLPRKKRKGVVVQLRPKLRAKIPPLKPLTEAQLMAGRA